MSDTPVKRPRGRPRKHPLPVEPTKVKHVVDDDDAGEMAVQGKLEEVNKPKAVEAEEKSVLPASPPPPGWRWVYNRLPEPYEARFNNRPIVFKAHEFQQVSADIAPHICAWSIIQLPASGPPVRALVLDGKKGFGKPFQAKRPVEMIDRASDPNPTGRGTDGIPTKPKLIYVGGTTQFSE